MTPFPPSFPLNFPRLAPKRTPRGHFQADSSLPQQISIFHYGFEGLIVNEVRYLSLVDKKYGLDIEVPGSAILSSFGFSVMALWEDCVGLAAFCAAFLVLAYGAMHVLLVEKR